MLVTPYTMDLLSLFSQYYNVSNEKKIDDLNCKEKEIVALTLLNESSSPYDPAELLLLPSGQNKNTILTILQAYHYEKIDAEETVRRIFNKIVESKKDELDKMFMELIAFEKLEYSSQESIQARQADEQYEMYCTDCLTI
jgi:hypothetical protein